MEEQMQEQKSYFERKVKPILFYVGAIGATITAIAYVAIVCIMVFGITVSTTPSQTIVFSLINAAIGLIILQFLKVQGITFAKNLPQNIPILKEFNKLKARTKKVHSLKYFWVTSVTKDIVIKALTICASTFGILYIVIHANNNYTLLLLALVNLLLFICFGLLALVKAYDFYNDEHIPFMQEVLDERQKEDEKQAALAELQRQNEILEEEKRREQNIEAEIARRVEMAKKEFIKQRNRDLLSDRGDNLLDSSMDTSTVSADSEPILLECSNSCDCILGGTDNTSSTPSIGADIRSEETLSNNEEETK